MPNDNTAPNAGEDAPFNSQGQTGASPPGLNVTATPTSEDRYNAALIKELKKKSKQSRNHRQWLFFSFGCLSIATILSILCCAVSYLHDAKIQDYAKNWQAMLAIDAIFIMLCFIFITIFITLVKFVQNSDVESKEKTEKLPSSPTEVMASLTSFLTAAKDLLKALRGMIKKSS